MFESNPDEFALRSLVRAVTETSGLRGPREIAAKVAENVPDGQLRAALAEALVAYVRESLTRQRRILNLTTLSAPSHVGALNSARSSKVAAIRESWRRTLAGQFHVGHGQWEVLADCSVAQVAFIAHERREHARRNAHVAGMFDELAVAMKRRKATRVGDLPGPTLAQILTSEVAA